MEKKTLSTALDTGNRKTWAWIPAQSKASFFPQKDFTFFKFLWMFFLTNFMQKIPLQLKSWEIEVFSVSIASRVIFCFNKQFWICISNLFIKILMFIFYQILLNIYYFEEYLKSFWRFKEIMIWKNLKFKYFAVRIVYSNGYCYLFNFLLWFNVVPTLIRSTIHILPLAIFEIIRDTDDAVCRWFCDYETFVRLFALQLSQMGR